VPGLDGDLGTASADKKKIDMKIIDSNEDYSIVDRDGDSLSFDNC